MKKLMIICGLLLATASFVNAQQAGANKQNGGRMNATPEERVKQLDEKVKLTDDQKTKASGVYTTAFDEMKKLREEAKAGGDMASVREKMTKMNVDNNAKIVAMLTDAQKIDYKTWQDEMRAARAKMREERQANTGNQ